VGRLGRNVPVGSPPGHWTGDKSHFSPRVNALETWWRARAHASPPLPTPGRGARDYWSARPLPGSRPPNGKRRASSTLRRVMLVRTLRRNAEISSGTRRFDALRSGKCPPMLAAALVLVLLGLLGLLVFPWGGIAAAAVGLVLLAMYLFGIGRAAQQSVSKD
jgi:hypothetical protein